MGDRASSIFFLFTAAVIGLFFVGFIYLIVDEITADHFSLRKDSWECIRSHAELTSHLTMVGKVPIRSSRSETVCDQWTRK